jgi:hypothetical protein
MRFLTSAAIVLMLAGTAVAEDTPPLEEGFVSLFDGKTLHGWKVGENADMFQVRDGAIVMECPAKTQTPAHLFYAGEVNGHDFKNFHLKVDVKTFPRQTRASTSIRSTRSRAGPISDWNARSITATPTGDGPAACGVSGTSRGALKHRPRATRKS